MPLHKKAILVAFKLINVRTLSPISLSGLSSVRYKTTQNTGSVGRAGAAPPTYKLGKFLTWPLGLSMWTYSNFQINGASGETLKVFVAVAIFK